MKESDYPVEVEDNIPRPLEAYGHAGQIHQVVVNLIENAVDAMAASETRRLTINASADNDGVLLTIRDTGSGISADDAPQIFEPFYTTKPVGMGTGLGLSISYGIVSQHNGELSIDNHIDGGAIASLFLPNRESADA